MHISVVTSPSQFRGIENHQGHGSLRERERHRNLPCPIWLEQTIHDFYQGTSACRAGAKLCPSTSRHRAAEATAPCEAKKEEEPVSAALKAEDTMKSYWHILQTDGSLVPIEEFKFKGHANLQKFSNYEIKKTRAVTVMPPHVPLMKRLEIADYEPGSDPGNIRWYPKGRMIKSLLEQYVTLKVAAYGGMEVETPLMYDFNHPSLKSYLNRFPARQYTLKSEDKELFLRFAACFGQFLMAHDAQFSYKQMPIKLYELTRYSFRREKSGEVVGLKRLRAFTMPDCHAFCTDLEQAKKEFMIRFNLCIDVLSNIGLVKDDYEIAMRFTKDFYAEHKDFITELATAFGKPILAEVWNERFFYFALKWDLNFIDNQDKAAALSTDQIDVENAKRYEITFVDEKGEKQYPLILHCSPSGAIERDIYASAGEGLPRTDGGKSTDASAVAFTDPSAAYPHLRQVPRQDGGACSTNQRTLHPRRHRRFRLDTAEENPRSRTRMDTLHHRCGRKRNRVRHPLR